MWPILTVILVLAVAVLHWRWRAVLKQLRAKSSSEIEELRKTWKQEALQIQTQQEALFDSMAEGLLVLDEADRIQIANRAFANLFGVPADLTKRTVMEAVRLHELAEVVQLLGTEKQVLGLELRLPGPDERWVQVNGAAVLNGDGSRHGTILVFHDLTRLKKLENARQEFIANVSHELRTPLSLIKGYVETLLDGAKDRPEVAVKFLHTIERNAERLKLLIEDLLTVSELESGRVRLNLQSVALGPAIGKVCEEFRARAAAKKMRLDKRVTEFKVRADADRLDQVLANLVDNAIKYGRADGQIVVGAEPAANDQVEVFVSDDGPGIPTEAQERIFERFYRVDKARSRDQGGTGLGLSIVKHIVQSHGGKVWVHSEASQGTTFHFTLPRDPGQGQQTLL